MTFTRFLLLFFGLFYSSDIVFMVELTPEQAAESILDQHVLPDTKSVPVKPLSASDNHLLEDQADGSHLLEQTADDVPSSEFSKSQIDLARQFDSALMPGPVILKDNASKLAETELVKDTDSAVMPGPEIPAKETAEKVAETGVAEHIDSALMPGPEVPAKEREENTAETAMAKDTDSAIMPGSEVPAKEAIENTAESGPDILSKETAENIAETEVAKQFDSALMPGPEILDKNTAETRAESETGGTVVDTEVSKKQIDMAKQFNSVLMPGPVLPDEEIAGKMTESGVVGSAVGSVSPVNNVNETKVGDVLPASSVSSGLLPNVQNIPKETARQYTETERPKMYEALPKGENNYPQSATGQENSALNNPIPDQRTSKDYINGKVLETLSQGSVMLSPNAVKNEVNTDTGDLSSNQINNDQQRIAFPAQGGEQLLEPNMVNTISNGETGVLDINKIRGEGDAVGSLSDKQDIPIQPENLVPDTNADNSVPVSGNMISNAEKKTEQDGDNIDPNAVLLGPADNNQESDVKVTVSTTTVAFNKEIDEFESTEINKYVDDNDAGDIKEADYDYDDDDVYEDDDNDNLFDNDDNADDEDVFGDVGNENEDNDLFDTGKDNDDDNNLNNFLNDFDDGKENNETYDDYVDGSITSTTSSTTRDYIQDGIDSEDDETDDDPFQWRDRLTEPFDRDEDYSNDEDETYDDDDYDEDEIQSMMDKNEEEESYARKMASNNMGFDRQLYGNEPVISVYSWILFFFLLFITLSFFAFWGRHRVFAYFHQLRHGRPYHHNMHYRRDEGRSLLAHEMI